MGQMLGSRKPFPTDYIIPVPLHWRKQWLRGYNQSEIIARGVVKGIISQNSYRSAPAQDLYPNPNA